MQITDLAFIDAAGYHYSDFPTFLQWITDKFQGIYGADTVVTPDSQDGQFLAVLAQAFLDTAAVGASVYNSFIPAGAQGAGLARLVKINGLTKKIPSFSTATVTLVGSAGKVITNGIAADTLGQKWLLPATVTFPGGGSIDVVVTAQFAGAFEAAPGTITTIFTPTQGWQSVTNAGAASPGAPVESDSALRIRQSQSTADPSLTVFGGTIGGLENLAGVTKVQGYENTTRVTNGNGIPGNSICCVVAGGDNTAIAREIQLHKTPGTGTYGNVSVPLFDSKGMPITISFQSALVASIQVTVSLTRGTGWSTDFESLIQAAIAAVINANAIGGNGQSGLIYYTTLFPAAYLNGSPQGQTYDITSITVGKNGGGQSSANVALLFNENPVCNPTVDVTFSIS